MLQKTEMIWQNGKFIPWAEAKIHVLSHGLHYGGAAFEGIRFYNTDQGSAIFRLTEHVERLFYSAEAVGMSLSYSKEEVKNAIIEVAQKSKLIAGYIRPLVFYGYGKLGVNPRGNPVEFIIACWPWGAYFSHEAVDIKTSRYIRTHPDSTKIEAKLSGHYLNGMLASMELQGTHYHEALFLDSDGYITEGVGENFFLVKNGILYTPKLGGILPGITRDTIIELVRHLGYSIIETNITLTDAYQADEAFFTGTAAEVTPIRSINDTLIADGKVGAHTLTIKKAYLNLVQGNLPEFTKYLSYLNSQQVPKPHVVT